jgi:hypothetical protein
MLPTEMSGTFKNPMKEERIPKPTGSTTVQFRMFRKQSALLLLFFQLGSSAMVLIFITCQLSFRMQ